MQRSFLVRLSLLSRRPFMASPRSAYWPNRSAACLRSEESALACFEVSAFAVFLDVSETAFFVVSTAGFEVSAGVARAGTPPPAGGAPWDRAASGNMSEQAASRRRARTK